MRCPFLREAQVKSCQASSVRKMIARSGDGSWNEKCTTRDYVSCFAAKQLHEDHPELSRCPFLQEFLVQYCAAAPVTKFIPYSESLLSRCGSDSHRFCELFRGVADPKPGTTDEDAGIDVPDNLTFAPNHLWLSRDDNGACYIGVDAFLVRVAGMIDAVSFLTEKGIARPAVVLGVSGAELHLEFPNPLLITRVNAYLRAHPERICADPYGSGWLFEGTELVPGKPRFDAGAGLIPSEKAKAWMDGEVGRVAETIQSRQSVPGLPLMNDGGMFHPGFIRMLPHDAALCFFNDFFSPLAGRRTL